MTKQILATQIFVSVDGQELQASLSSAIQSVVVDQHVHLPSSFTITLSDSRTLEVLDSSPLNLTKKVKIEANNEDGTKYKLIEGEITALEPEFNDGMNARLKVRGYDKSHQMFRELKSTAHLNKKDSDLAREFAGSAGLSAEVSDTPIVYEHIYQDNQSDLAFLTQRAWRIGYECYVEDEKLIFRPPKEASDTLEITWGFELQTFYPRVTLAEQVDEVVVRGWDVAEQTPIIGRASGGSGTLYPKIPEPNGSQQASKFGSGKLIVLDQSVENQSEADVLAQARLDEVSGAFVQAEGSAFRRPDIKAGRLIDIKALGKRLSGTYQITRARHTYSQTGLRTNFSVTGARAGTLAAGTSASRREVNHWPGLVTAKVTNVNDEKKWGCVKVKYPWMTEDAESNWVRIVSAGAGPEAGAYMIPDVDDEVIIGFEHGDINRPLILGGVWNGQHDLPPEAGTDGEQPKTRIWQSRAGHKISLFETQEKQKIELVTEKEHTVTMDDKEKRIVVTSTDGHEVVIDDKEKRITVTSSGGHEIVLDDQARKISVSSTGDIEIEAEKSISVKAGVDMKLEAKMIDISATGPVNIKGKPVNIN